MKGRDVFRLWLAALLLLALLFARTLATWLTELWWYQQVGFSGVFWTLLGAQALLGVTVGLLCAVCLGLTAWTVVRGRTRVNARNPQVVEFRRPGSVPRLLPPLTAAVVAFLALSVGLEASSRPDLLLNFLHAQPFGQVDPLFGHDVAFYVFRLPLVEYFYDRFFLILGLCLVVAVVLHFLVRTVQVVPDQFMIAPQARRQLLNLLGGLFLLKTFGYWLDTYGLLSQSRNGGAGAVLAGADYTDIHVRLPILYLLMLLSLACAVSLWLNKLPRQWRVSVALVTALVLVGFSGDVALPVLAQRFVVKPNELELERLYLQRSIDFTRMAYNLGRIQVDSFPAEAGFTTAEKDSHQAILDNIPLWDHHNLLPTLQQTQEIRKIYDIQNVDNDRYTIDGQYRQVMVAPRELSEQNLPTTNWISSHLTYTHGYGVVMTRANQIEAGGKPAFVVQDIPPRGPASLKIDKPQIYFGELSNDYCFVHTASKEFDYPTNSQTSDSAFIEYAGAGGIPITADWQKWLYFMRFGETNILLSQDIQAGSQVMFHREVRERVSQVTPWVTYDKDAYMVVSGGQLFWILDGYTTSNAYPYSVANTSETLPGNYVRNSVKAVVNAYDGAMHFYISDTTDPMVATYAAIFPGLFQPLGSMPADLQAHLRYPKQLFEIQAGIYGMFHMTEPQNFYTRQDLWQVAVQKDTGSMEPYYAMLKLKEGDREEFVLMLPFSPAGKQNMVAWMAARCDSPHYGELVAYEFPRQKNIYGPSQIVAQLNQNPDISKSLTLWSQKGSTVDPGTLLVVPIGDSIIYVQPLYLSATGQKTMPELIAVIVSDGDHLAMGSNLEEALARVLSSSTTAAMPGSITSTDHPVAAPSSTSLTALSWPQLVDQANGDMAGADAAQRAGHWAEYGDHLSRLQADLQEMKRRGGPPETH